jgi:hypothetical protein
VALFAGGEGTTCAVEHLLVPCDLDLHAACLAYQRWLAEVYNPTVTPLGRARQPYVRVLCFGEYLRLRHGADPADVETFATGAPVSLDTA